MKGYRCPQLWLGRDRCVKEDKHSGDCLTGNGTKWQATDWPKALHRPISAYPSIEQVDAIKAWRWWAIGPRGFLQSITSNHIWYNSVMTTRRDRETGQLLRVAPRNPIEGCLIPPGHDWGVFSYKKPSLLFHFNKHLMSMRPLVLGNIAMEAPNHVIEHEHGYRAQQVRVIDLTVFYEPQLGGEAIPNFWRTILAQRYECTVTMVEHGKLESWSKYYSEEEL